VPVELSQIRQIEVIKGPSSALFGFNAVGGVINMGELLLPVVRHMRGELLGGSYIQADETPVGVQMHDKRGKNHQGYLWQYGAPGGSVVFDFRMSREREGPKQFLQQFNGILQTDRYAAYDRIGGPKMVHACCLAHARRKYIDAIKLDPRDQDAAPIVRLIDELFALDATAREQAMDHGERHALRSEKAPALLAELRAQILAAQKRVLPKSASGKAASYTLAFWNKLTLFLEYPQLELSNNLAENHATDHHRPPQLDPPRQRRSRTQGRGHLLHRRKLPQTRTPHPRLPRRYLARTRQSPKPRPTHPRRLRRHQNSVT
jgi:hypothetical protein